ncbi:MAG: pseudouridylate synthase [Bdellovibrionaceae bacterium]|nr:pseudouridylate synthase [Pseudobdellovibrionaceae bacterium]
MADLIRLNKYIAESGFTSRRKADELIEQGSVKINGKTVYEMGIKIDPENDRVTVKGKSIQNTSDRVYYMFHKPKQVVTTTSDPEGRRTVLDFFKKESRKRRLFPVGRLDWDTEGLLLITDDGEFANSVSSPKSDIPKVYLCKLDGQPTDKELQKLKDGVSIPQGGKVKALFIERSKKGSSKQYDWIKIGISEGKNRQVRKMFAKLGYDVKKLKRVAIGSLKLGLLKPGEFRPMSAQDISKIFKSHEKNAEQQQKRPRPRSRRR